MREMPTAADVLKILHAAYDVEQPKNRWLTGVLEAMTPILDRGAGIGGLLYDVSRADLVQVDFTEGLKVPFGWQAAGVEVHQDSRFIPYIIACYRSRLCATLSQLFPHPKVFRSLRSEYYDRHGIGEQIMINGIDGSGRGCCFYVFSRGPIALSEAQRDMFSRLATHFSTAYRLQRQLAGSGQAKANGIQALLPPIGQVDHAEAKAKSREVRQDLTLAVRPRESARDAASRDAESTMKKTSRGLVSARWTLLDHYESSGQRYVLQVDGDGVSLAAIKALSQRVKELDARNRSLEDQVSSLRARFPHSHRGDENRRPSAAP